MDCPVLHGTAHDDLPFRSFQGLRLVLLRDIAAICGSVTVILIFFAAVARVRWVRWMWAKLVSEPTGRWLKDVVAQGAQEWHVAAVEPRLAAIEKQLLTNDGSTLRDEVVRTREIAEQAATTVQQLARDRGLIPAGTDPTDRQGDPL